MLSALAALAQGFAYPHRDMHVRSHIPAVLGDFNDRIQSEVQSQVVALVAVCRTPSPSPSPSSSSPFSFSLFSWRATGIAY